MYRDYDIVDISHITYQKALAFHRENFSPEEWAIFYSNPSDKDIIFLDSEDNILCSAILFIENKKAFLKSIMVERDHRYYYSLGSKLLVCCEMHSWFKGCNEIYAQTIVENGSDCFFERNKYELVKSLHSNTLAIKEMRKVLRTKPKGENTITENEVWQIVMQQHPDVEKAFLEVIEVYGDEYHTINHYALASRYTDFIFDQYKKHEQELFQFWNKDKSKLFLFLDSREYLRDLRIFSALIEDLNKRGDRDVRNIVIVGILEDLQNVWLRNESPELFLKLLTGDIKRYWDSIMKFWNKEIPYIGSDIGE